MKLNITPSDERVVHFPRSVRSRIPFKMFSSPEIYRLEQSGSFVDPVWSFVAMESRDPELNDFKSAFVGDLLGVVPPRGLYRDQPHGGDPGGRPLLQQTRHGGTLD